jgi:hypothetical protein
MRVLIARLMFVIAGLLSAQFLQNHHLAQLTAADDTDSCLLPLASSFICS